MGTPHIAAKPGDIAPRILLPGDPLRAKFIADNFLEDVKCYNTIRGMLGFTGTYKGKEVSVQGTGMGQPSIGIYASELIQVYGVKRLIRTGTCGTFSKVSSRCGLLPAIRCRQGHAGFGLRGKGSDNVLHGPLL